MRDASLDDFFSNSDEESEGDDSASEDEVDTEVDAEAEVEADAEPDAELEADGESEAEMDTEEESDSEPVSVSEAEPEGPPPVAAVEPARSTYAWSPDGAACADCGEQVEERWESEVGLVCVECKMW